MARYRGKVKLVVLDTAGVVCDGPQDLRAIYPNDDGKGVKAPVVAFDETLARHGIHLDWATIRKPMGLFKRTHLQRLLEDERGAAAFTNAFGHAWTEGDLDRLFEDFRPVLDDVIVREELAKPIDGANECVAALRGAGIIIGCDTGYTASASGLLNAVLARKFGLAFDVTTNAEIVKGRPSPFMVFDCMAKADCYPVEAVVKVDDTRAGMHEGRNAGAWTVGCYESGNDTYEQLLEVEPDFLIPSIKDLPKIVFDQVEPRLQRGELPGQGGTHRMEAALR
jgi:phosphonoacetaldehyde hydrolase